VETLKFDLRICKWMLGLTLVLEIAITVRLFTQ
jgi:hypothetical protein